jgi:hypothetical protein
MSLINPTPQKMRELARMSEATDRLDQVDPVGSPCGSLLTPAHFWL